MAVSAAFVSLSLLTCLPTVAAAPSAQSVGSDLSIVTHNDLYGNFTARTATAIALDARCTYSTATSRCAALGTALWSPNNRKQDLDLLRYLDNGKPAESATAYWVQGNDASHCRAVTIKGEYKTYSCDAQLSALCSNTATGTPGQVTVSTRGANITGQRTEQAFRFLGIKYASIPARFSPSTYFAPASKTNALAYGPACFQATCALTSQCSEDCLSLNIWTPYLPRGPKNSGKKAVMLWIHGGSFTSGTGRNPNFDGSALASRGDVVLVTINYRLSTLGFLALENTNLTGNYGLRDQNVALDWLKAHIEDFGGDKNKITVFGQSAGAASVRALVASPQSQPKIAGAIFQSTPQGLTGADLYVKYSTRAEATNRSMSLVHETGCAGKEQDVVDCLRQVDPLVLVGFRNTTQSFTGTVAANPVIDGAFLPRDLQLGPSASKMNFPVLNGILRDDGSPLTAYPTSTNVSEVLTSQGYPANAILSSQAFPIPENSNTTLSIFNLTSRLATDGFFRCGGQSTAHVAAKNRIFSKVYAYEFDRAYQSAEWSPNPPSCEAPVTPGYPFGNPDAPFYKCHAGELLTVFGTIIRRGRPQRDANDVPFSQYIVDTWSAFARTGNPVPDAKFLRNRGYTNTTKFVEQAGKWEAVGEGSKPIRVLSVPLKNEAWREVKQCEVLGLGLEYYNT